MIELDGRPYTIEVPMDNGSSLLITHDGQQTIRPPYTYAADGFATHHNASCLLEPKFQEAYNLGANSGHTLIPQGQQLHVEWRVHQYIWAAWH